MIVANWKMNGDRALCLAVAALAGARTDVVVCPPATLIDFAHTAGLTVGAQDVSAFENGARTGQISATLCADAGATYAIIGHSERRGDGDTDDIVAQKLGRAIAAGLTPILCVSDAAQIIDAPVVAYEPVWAIGTDKTPTISEIEEFAAQIRERAPAATILYGGSVDDKNAAEILGAKNIGGVLVGGASLDIEKFKTILQI